MINKILLKERLVDKFNTIGLHEIANECFVKALPYDDMDLAPIKRDLHAYTGAVLESFGGFSALTNAMESETNPMKRSLLTKIYNICNTSACEAAERVMDEIDPEKDNLPEVVDSAQFTEEEIQSFIKKSDDLTVDDVAKAVQQKTLQVIKEEQEAYQKADEIKQELNDAVSDSPILSEDATMESYLKIVLSRGDTREHNSFFSKLQDVAMEAVLRTTEEYVELPIQTMITMAKEGMFTGRANNHDLDTAIESYKLLTGKEKTPEDKARLADVATLTAVVAYTALECFHTLNLYNPSPKEIRSLVERPDWYRGMIEESKNLIATEAKSVLASNRKLVMNSNDIGVLQEVSSNMKACMEAFATFDTADPDFVEEATAIKDTAENIASTADAKVEALGAEPTPLPGYVQRQKEENVASVNRVARYYVNNPEIAEIRILLPKASSDPTIAKNNELGTVAMELKCTNANREPVTESFLMIKNHPDFKMTLEQVVTEAIANSKLAGNSSVKIERKTM